MNENHAICKPVLRLAFHRTQLCLPHCGILKFQNTGADKKRGIKGFDLHTANTSCKKRKEKKNASSFWGEEKASRHVKWLGGRRLLVFLLPFAGWRGGAGGGSLFFGALKAGEQGKANCSLARCSVALKNVELSRQGKGLMQFKKRQTPTPLRSICFHSDLVPLRGGLCSLARLCR